MAASPTPPQPNTATVSPRCTLPVLHRRAEAGHHAAAEQAGDRGVGGVGSTFVHWPAATSVFSANAPMPSAGDSSVPSSERHLLGRVVVAKQYCGLPLRHARHSPHTARQLRTDEVAGGHVGDALADRLDHAGGLVAEQEREVVVDAALPVVQVGVAHTARLRPSTSASPGPGVGDHDRLDTDRLALAPRHHASHFVSHGASLPNETESATGQNK